MMAEITIGAAITSLITANNVLDITGRIMGQISSLLVADCEKINQCVKRLDLKAKLRCIETMIKYYGQTRCLLSKKVSDDNNRENEKEPIFASIIDNYTPIVKDMTLKVTETTQNPIEIHLYYVYEIIQDIQKEFEKINDKIKCHKNKYFSEWRHLNIESCLINLETYDAILKQRYDRFLKVLEMPSINQIETKL